MPKAPGWPPLSTYLATRQVLGYEFDYPAVYLESISWENDDIDAGGDGHCLSFLQSSEVELNLFFVKRATHLKLVPFARGDNGDSLFCFDGSGSPNIYVINIAEKHLTARKVEERGYVNFLNSYRANQDLPPWKAK